MEKMVDFGESDKMIKISGKWINQTLSIFPLIFFIYIYIYIYIYIHS